ncbi:MAG TPA: class I SAM-dependent methyltransferase [Gaiellaceae bacterium]|nr:class I SAM-dependent methyltransferase [Gaiellaceae bacterium]
MTAGNAAKLYCLRLLDEAAARAGGEFRILDLGCGDGGDFVELVRRRENVSYVGVEPSQRAAAAAARALPSARIVNAPAYDIRDEAADVVVSFSVLEHVVDRARYFDAVVANLAPGGRVYLNYDSGHFYSDANPVERARAIVGSLLARAGDESHYRAVVTDSELEAQVARTGLHVVDDKGFNTELKVAWRHVPAEQREAFMKSWLAFELDLNAAGIGYRPYLYRTRNVILEG